MPTIPTQTLVLYFVAGTLGFAVITMLGAAYFINNKTFAGLFFSKKNTRSRLKHKLFQSSAKRFSHDKEKR